MKPIQEEFYCQDQSWNYLEVFQDDSGQRFRIEIRRNAYDNQSYARIKRWDGSQWQFVTSVPLATCTCKDVSYVDPSPNINNFKADAAVLRLLAFQICG